MERRFDFFDILDHSMLMERIAFFTPDFFTPQPNTAEQTQPTWRKVFAEQFCFQE